MHLKHLFAISAAALLIFAAGCNAPAAAPKVNTAPFKPAIDAYFQAHPSCLWPAPVQFPVKVAADQHPAEAQQYDALVSAGLLTKKTTTELAPPVPHHRRTREKVSVYSLTDQGKSALTRQSGGSNFCYATPHIVSIDNYTPEPNSSRYGVSYHFAIGTMPSWTSSAKVRAAFPRVGGDAAGQNLTGLATLTKNSTGGWTVSSVQSMAPLVVRGS